MNEQYFVAANVLLSSFLLKPGKFNSVSLTSIPLTRISTPSPKTRYLFRQENIDIIINSYIILVINIF